MVDCTPRRFLVNNSDTGLPHAPLLSLHRYLLLLISADVMGINDDVQSWFKTAHRLRIKSITKEEKQTVTS